MRATASTSTESRQQREPIVSDDDPTSSSGSSSSASEGEEDSEDKDEEMHDEHRTSRPAHASSIPHVAGRPKPNIHRMEGGSDLLSRLSSFLPKMKNANEDLEKEIAAGRGQEMVLDSVDDDGKDYIEMNLGLGVLEEKRGGDEDISSGDEGDDESPNGDSHKAKDNGEPDLLGQLMGGITSSTDKPSIEEMAD